MSSGCESDDSIESTFDDTGKDPDVKYKLKVESVSSRPKRNTVVSSKDNNPSTTAVGLAKAKKLPISTAVEPASQNISVKASTRVPTKQEILPQHTVTIHSLYHNHHTL